MVWSEMREQCELGGHVFPQHMCFGLDAAEWYPVVVNFAYFTFKYVILSRYTWPMFSEMDILEWW